MVHPVGQRDAEKDQGTGEDSDQAFEIHGRMWARAATPGDLGPRPETSRLPTLETERIVRQQLYMSMRSYSCRQSSFSRSARA